MKRSSKRLQILLAVTLLLYACGYLTQFIGNYAVWQKNGGMPGGTSPPFPSLSPPDCLKGILWFPYNLYCIAGCAATVAAIFLYRKLFSQDALTDSERNFDFSAKGTYGTSGWMQPREIPAVLDMVSDLSQHTGTVLGMLDGKFLCIPEKTRMNGNLAVYGASGSMKTRSFCMNRILQSAVRGESLIICDPKSELYEKSSEYMRDLGYTVRVFNLVSPENSDSWNCLKEIEGQELMAQLFVDVIIKNTNGTGKSDRFWDSGEMNLLKALVLYVDLTYPPEQRTIGEVYNLITQCSESQLDSLFDVLPLTHPAKAPYSLYQRASDSVRSGVISGLGSRLQVFQSDLIKKITAYDEISLELPGQQPCAYYLVTSDQDSTFDFLASLTREVSNTRGKLTIRMDGSYSTSGNSLTAFFSAMGNWSGTGSDPSACPSSGADVAGFHWGGNISTGETTARGEYGDNSSATVTLAGGTSNEAIAWYFTEKEAFKYIKNVFFNLNMSKSSLTGNGNTTELYFTYIHTYQSYNVTGSISASGAGISISNVANQWPLSVRLYGIPY